MPRLTICPCGSGQFPEALHDGHGIFLCYVCDKCKAEKLSHYRPDIFEKYRCDEPIEPEHIEALDYVENERGYWRMIANAIMELHTSGFLSIATIEQLSQRGIDSTQVELGWSDSLNK